MEKVAKRENKIANHLPKYEHVTVKGADGQKKQIVVQDLNPLVVNYMLGVTNPHKASDIKSPFGYPVKTQTMTAYLKFDMECGTTGYGFIILKPTTCGDVTALDCTTAASVGGATTQLNAFTLPRLYSQMGTPVSSTTFNNPSVGARWVCGGFTFYSTDNGLQRDGEVIIFEQPDHLTVEAMQWKDIKNTNWARTMPVNDGKNKFSVFDSGFVNPNDFDLQTLSNGIYPRGNAYPMGALVFAHPGAKFSGFMTVHFEMSGPLFSMTHTVANIEQANYALAATKDVAMTMGALSSKDALTTWEKFKGFVSSNLPTIINAGQAIGGAAVAAITRNPQALAIAADGVKNLLSSAVTQPKLTDTQRMILQNHPDHAHMHDTNVSSYFTIFQLIYRNMFDFKLAVVEQQACWVPVPKPTAFCTINQEPSTNPYTIQVAKLQNLDFTSFDSYYSYLDEVQDVLDKHTGQEKPKSQQEIDATEKIKRENAELQEIYKKLTPDAWLILTKGGPNAFVLYLKSVHGDRAADLYQEYGKNEGLINLGDGKFVIPSTSPIQ